MIIVLKSTKFNRGNKNYPNSQHRRIYIQGINHFSYLSNLSKEIGNLKKDLKNSSDKLSSNEKDIV